MGPDGLMDADESEYKGIRVVNYISAPGTVYIGDHYLQTSSISHSEDVFVDIFPNEKIQSHQ